MERKVSAGTAVLAVALTAVVAALVTTLASGGGSVKAAQAAPAALALAKDDPAAAAGAGKSSEVEYLFAQAYQGGTLSGPDDKHLTLTVRGLRKHVTAFTDRPDRAAHLIANADFYRMWDPWFAGDPPNAVLSFTPKGAEEPVGLVVEISHPRWNATRTIAVTS